MEKSKMTDKINREKAREKFRSGVSIKDIGTVDEIAGYATKWVDCQFLEGLKRIDRYIDKNWDVVYSKEKAKDDRKNNADQAVVATVPKPVTRTTRSGHTQILMKIKTELRNENALEKAAKDMARLNASRKRKVDQSGNVMKVHEEVNMMNLGDGNIPEGNEEV